MGQRVDLGGLVIGLDLGQTRQGVHASCREKTLVKMVSLYATNLLTIIRALNFRSHHCLLTNIHGAGTTDSLATGSSEGQTRVHLILDLDERVQHHGAAVVQVHLVVLHLRLGPRLLRIPSEMALVTMKKFLRLKRF